MEEKEVDYEVKIESKEDNSVENIEMSAFDPTKIANMYSRYIEDSSSDERVILTNDDITLLGMNTQNSLSKIQKINQYARFYINTDDLVGKVYETIENNVNADIKLNFPKIKVKRDIKTKDKAEELIKQFNKDIDIENLVRKAISMSYVEGNHLMYLRKGADRYIVDNYTLGAYEISDYKMGGESLCIINMRDLESKLKKVGIKDKKGKGLFLRTLDEEFKENYPKEVYEAYKEKEKFAILNIENTGLVRINNLERKYGVTPIFRTFKPLVALDIYDRTNNNTANANNTKILAQILDPNLLDKEGKFDNIPYLVKIHENFLASIKSGKKSNFVVTTAYPGVKEIQYVEPKTQQIDVNQINIQRNKILTALGINFLSSDKTSYTSAEINVKELMKTINKLASQVEKILEKWYKVLLRDNGISYTMCPSVQVIDSEMLETDIKLKLTTTLFDKLGASYKTAFELLGLDFEAEKQRREEENNYISDLNNEEVKGMDNIFYPRKSAFTISSNDTVGSSGDDVETKNKEKQKSDEDRYKSKRGNKQTMEQQTESQKG